MSARRITVRPVFKRVFVITINEFRDVEYTLLDPTPRQLVAKQELFDKICWNGDWTNLPRTCGGDVQVWDQTVGCPECGMNLWYLPAYGQWPLWDKANEPPEDWWENVDWKDHRSNPYVPYVRLFDLLHPFQFSDAHDPGDESPD
jgi:hypothetical protein